MKINLRDSKGITIIALIITIIIMIILATISIKYGFDSVNSTQDSVIEASLETVQQALLEQYSKANTIEGVGKKIDEDGWTQKSDGYIGTPLNAEEINQYLNENGVIRENGFNLLKFDASNYSDTVTYDTAYYKLEESDLEKLGIEDAKGRTYLVNYSTGEVWDLANVKYDDGSYAYINGIGTSLEISKEDFTDCPIKITLLDEMHSNGDNYVIPLKVTDDLAKISDKNKDDHITVDDFTTGRIRIKIDNTEKTIDEIRGKIEISHIDEIKKYIIKKDETQSIGEHYEYNILISKTLFPVEASTVTLIIDEGVIKDEKEYTNLKTELNAIINDKSKIGTIEFTLGEPEYKTKSEENPNGYEDLDGKKWGNSAIVELTLKCDTGLLNQDYVFNYVWSKTSPNASENGTITLRPREGDKEVKGNIYLDSYTGAGVLTVSPSSNYSGNNSNKLSKTKVETKSVNLDNEFPVGEVYVKDASGKLHNLDEYSNTYFRLDTGFKDNKPTAISTNLYPSMSIKFCDNESGLYRFIDNTGHLTTGWYYSFSSEPKSNLIMAEDVACMWGYNSEQKYKNVFEIEDVVFSTTHYNSDLNQLTSGEFYINMGLREKEADIIMIDNVGNTEVNATARGPIKIDFFYPTINNIIFDSNENAQITISDDYSGLSNDYSKIKYGWVKSKEEKPKEWYTITEENIKPIRYNNSNNILKLQATVESPSTIGEWYLCTTIEGYKDVAGNEASKEIVYSDEPVICEGLNIEVSETEELGYPKAVNIEMKSNSNKKFKIKNIWYEHIGLNDKISIIDKEISCSGSYKTTFSSTVNGPVRIHIIDSYGNEYIEEYTISKVQETILTYNIDNSEESLILPIMKWGNSMPLVYVDWGDGNKEYILNPSYGLTSVVLPHISKLKVELYENGEHIPIHKYTTLGHKEVKISGGIESRFVYDPFMGNNMFVDDEEFTKFCSSRDKLIEIKQFGIHKENSVSTWNMDYTYSGCKKLIKLPNTMSDVNKNAFSDISEMKYTFYNSGIEKIPNGFFDKATNVNNFEYTFANTPITGIPENLFDNTKNVKYFGGTFANTSITEIPEKLFGNTPNVESFINTFKMTPITEIPENLFDNTKNVKYFVGTFECTPITEIPENLFYNTPNVEYFTNTFTGTPIIEIPENLFYNTPNVKDFTETFASTSIAEIPENLFENTGNVSSFKGTFSGTPITKIPASLFVKTTDVSNFISTFANTKITEIPESLFDNTGEVTDFSYTFENTPIEEIKGNLFFKTTNVTTFSHTFSNTKITEIPKNLFDNTKNVWCFDFTFSSTPIKSIPPEIFKFTREAHSFLGTFSNTKIESIPETIFNYCQNSSYKDFRSCFSGCTELLLASNSMWDEIDKSTIKLIASMFEGCSSLKSVDNIFQGLTNVESLDKIFMGCTSLKNVNKNIFRGCSNVTSLGGTFCNCQALENLDKTVFDDMKDKVKNLSYKDWGSNQYYGIFQGCKKLKICPEIWDWKQMESISETEAVYNIFYQTSNDIINKIPKNKLKNCWIINNTF